MKTWLVIATFCLVWAAQTAWAQPGPPGPPRIPITDIKESILSEFGPIDEADARELIEMVRMVRLSEELGLNDEQAVLLIRKFREAREQATASQKQRHLLSGELRALIDAGADTNAIQEKLDALLEHDRNMWDARFNMFESAVADFDPVQRAKLYLFMGEFESRLRGIVDRVRRHRMEEGEGPPTYGPRGQEGERPFQRGRTPRYVTPPDPPRAPQAPRVPQPTVPEPSAPQPPTPPRQE